MKQLNSIVAMALLCSAGAATGQSAGTPQRVFACWLGAKGVSVTRVGGNLIYAYGAPGRTELSIIGNARAGNVHQLTQRYAGTEFQLRFSSGAYSYIVYAAAGNARTGAHAVSGLVVMRGQRRISDKTCVRFAKFSNTEYLLDVPEDNEDYSAM